MKSTIGTWTNNSFIAGDEDLTPEQIRELELAHPGKFFEEEKKDDTQYKSRSSMGRLNKLAMIPVIYAVTSLVSNTQALAEEDCSTKKTFKEKVACKKRNANDESSKLDEKIIVVKADADAITTALKTAEEVYKEAKDTYESVKEDGGAAVKAITDVVKTVSDTVEKWVQVVWK